MNPLGFNMSPYSGMNMPGVQPTNNTANPAQPDLLGLSAPKASTMPAAGGLNPALVMGGDTLAIFNMTNQATSNAFGIFNSTKQWLSQLAASGGSSGGATPGVQSASTGGANSGGDSTGGAESSGAYSGDGTANGQFDQDWSKEMKHIPAGERDAFLKRVLEIARKLEMDPDHLMAIFMAECGMDPKAVNKDSGATGLIQFMPATAKGLGTSTSALRNMSALQQLDYVEKYLSRHKGKMKSLSDAYMAVFSPAFMGKGDNNVCYQRGQGAYTLNAGLDANKDGKITNGELAIRLKKYLA